MEATFIAVIAGLMPLAFVVGRAWGLILPFAVVPILYLGLGRGWWGHGLGDGWQFAMLFVLGLGVGAAAIGLAARSVTRRH